VVGWHWYFSAVALLGGACLTGYTLYVWPHRKASAGASLALMLAAAGWWGLAYALELAATRLPVRLFWGDAKWLGIALLPPAFYAFVMQYTGRPQWVTRRTMAALAVVPAATVALLAVPATHDLVRYYPPSAAADPANAIAQVGPLFWPFLVYANLVLWGSTALFVWTLTRVSRRYWRQSLLLVVAVLLPSVANLAHNLNLGPFRHVEPTPFLFVLTGAVLVWGLFRFRLLDLAPAARTSVFETMLDAALVLDPYRRVVKLNPAAERALGVPAPRALGHQVEQLLGVEPALVERADDPVLPEEVELTGRRYELSTTPLADRSGRVTGKVVVLRDVTERHLAHERLLRLDQQRRWLLRRVVWAQEEERRRIAGEVHDDAIQTIAAARLMLTTFRDQLSDDRQRRLLDHLEEAVSSSLRRLRTLVFDLRPAQLDDDGLAAALREYLTETARQGGFVATLRDDLEREPPAEARVIAYRICQEALTNVRVHARARWVEVRLEEAQGGLQVTVTDDGAGFEADQVKATPRRGHLGLTSMSERATMADGWCRVDSHPGQGTTVRFWLPTKDTG
jgi:PAS domain S-box-containing protein